MKVMYGFCMVLKTIDISFNSFCFWFPFFFLFSFVVIFFSFFFFLVIFGTFVQIFLFFIFFFFNSFKILVLFLPNNSGISQNPIFDKKERSKNNQIEKRRTAMEKNEEKGNKNRKKRTSCFSPRKEPTPQPKSFCSHRTPHE